MSRCLKPLLMLVLAMTLFGCVGQKPHDDLQTLYRKAQEQIVDLTAQLDEKDAQIAALRESSADSAAMRARLQAAEDERAALLGRLAEMEQRMRDLARHVQLPADVDAALRALAAASGGLMTYDADRGMVKFASDLTFTLGSTQVSSAASGSLNQLAQILNSASAQKFEVRVVGHTDNVPIKRVRAQHPTNWHLAVHRAIAVKDVLENSGVASARLGVAGYGEHRPLVPNGPKGAQANRRVEIFLVPMPKDVELGAVPTTEGPGGPSGGGEVEQPDAFK